MDNQCSADFLSRPSVPNTALRLLHRELAGHPSGAGVHIARAFSECIVPTHKGLETEAPDVHIGRFTPDGKALVCFSLQLESVVLFDYWGPVPQPHLDPNEPVTFNRFFTRRWQLALCVGSEQLSRDFCLALQDGAFLLLASATPQRREGTEAAAGAGPTGPPAPPAAGVTLGDHEQQQQQQQGLDQVPAAGEAAGNEAQHVAAAPERRGASRRPPSSDCCEITTFHVVDVQRCLKVDERRFPSDYFDLSGNGCVSLYEDRLALTSIRTQTIHILQVNADGSLTDVQQIGSECQADDLLPIQLAAAAEQQWQLQRQQERQQQEYWMHRQARALLPSQHRPGAPQQQQAHQRRQRHESQPPQQPPQHQRRPTQHQLAVRSPHGPHQQAASRLPVAAAAAAAADGRRSGGSEGLGRRQRASSSSDEGLDDETDDSMDSGSRRRTRRRLNIQPPQPPQLPLPQPPAEEQQQRQVLPQLEQQQQPFPAAAGDVERSGRSPVSPTSAGGAAAAAAAAAAAVLDPGGQLIRGVQQRLLSFLYKNAAGLSHQPCEVAPTLWDFQYNFAVLSSLVIWRARLIGRQQLLLKVGAPTSGPAAAAELNPNRVHFFGIYDLASTKFKGFWKASSSELLTAVLEHPYRLLCAKADVSPWERCCAAALYPPGYPIGIEQQQQLTQQPPPPAQHQQQHSVGPGGRVHHPRGQLVSRASDAVGTLTMRSAAAGAAAVPAAVSPAVAGTAPGSGSSAAAGAGAAADLQLRGSRMGDSGSSNNVSSGKAARDRLKLLRQVVLMVLPGLQNLSPSPYLDPHLYVYSKHLSPVIGLRNSAIHPLRFRLARRYKGFEPAVEQHQVPLNQQPLQASQQASQQQDMLQLDPAQPPVVAYGNEEVARRQLHIFHPTDPFVLVVVQTVAQPATLSIFFKM